MENNNNKNKSKCINMLLDEKTLMKAIKIALKCLADEENVVGPKGLLIIKSDKKKDEGTLIYVIDKKTGDFLICAESDSLPGGEYLFVEKEDDELKKINNNW